MPKPTSRYGSTSKEGGVTVSDSNAPASSAYGCIDVKDGTSCAGSAGSPVALVAAMASLFERA
jgi:hypothetical protein